MALELRTLNDDNIKEITKLFFDVFSKEPWNDDWSDENQLNAYILDLTGNNNSLTLGFYENGVMIGLSMGRVKHWFSGTEYCIDEFCIKTEEQGRGLGRQFLEAVESFIKQKGMSHIFLQTERNMPAYDFYKRNGFHELENHVSLVKQC